MAEGRRGKKDSVTVSDSLLTDIEPLIEKAVTAAMNVLREEFAKRLDEHQERISELEKAMEHIEQRLSAAEASVDSVRQQSAGVDAAASSDGQSNEQLQAVKDEARQFMIIANDNEQHNRMNNLRIRGITVARGENCRNSVTEFIRSKLHIHISPEDLEAAHPLPSKSSTELTAATRQQQEPTVIVRFWRREQRDDILRNRRLLKGTPFTISEDLTSLNLKTLNRLRNNQQVAKTWSWNGRLYALLTTGRRILVKPFQTIEQCLAQQ